MAGLRNTRNVPSLPPPLPKDPPAYPDLYGRRREFARVQLLEREIESLEEELKLAEGLHPASKACKEVADFVTANSDPFIPVTKKVPKSSRFWKWLCGSLCLDFSRSCCVGSTHHPDSQRCCNCNGCVSMSCMSCSKHKSSCCSSEASQSCKMPKCSSTSCTCECHPFTNCLSKCCVIPCRKCLSVDLCSCCKRYSCYHCCICY